MEREAAPATERHEGLQELERSFDWEAGGDLAFYGRLTLEWGLRFTTMQQEWAARAAERIRDRAQGHTDGP
ncbi:hypothetical protein [Actinacidiphila sp. bgisy160]|uniref:hypothetical protein n=1 Tax=Actinacidiphila sp. bgisy160 TaxID=3413796 RepID=UPI003D716AA4